MQVVFPAVALVGHGQGFFSTLEGLIGGSASGRRNWDAARAHLQCPAGVPGAVARAEGRGGPALRRVRHSAAALAATERAVINVDAGTYLLAEGPALSGFWWSARRCA